jgi:hypothetical protein
LLSIDYTLSIQHIYQQFTETLITETGSLHVLHMFGVQKRINTLPSWVPDYSICRPVATLPAAYCEERESYYGQIKRAERGRLWVEFRKDCLVTRGKRLCHIKTLGETLPANQAFALGSHKFGLILRGWEEMILDVDASKSPIPICEAFMRAITAYDEDIDELSQTLDFDWALCWYRKYGSNVLYDADDSAFQELRDRLDLMAWTMPKEGYTQRLEEIINRLSKRVEDVCYERRFFIADDGNIGVAPSGSQPGDSIVMFQNGLYPFVVRPQKNRMSTLIGDCFHYNLAEGKPTLYEQFVVEEGDWIEEEEMEEEEDEKEEEEVIVEEEQLGTNSDQGELQNNTEGAEVDQGTNVEQTDEDWTENTGEGAGGHGGDLFNDLYILC